jgi:two-component system, chemotaxis family, protein-glutamate methylesterase/glutaminase
VSEDVQVRPHAPPGGRVIVAGASAGGVEALVALVQSLPSDFPFPVLVVLHVSPTGTSVLPSILARAGVLPVAAPIDGDRLRAGHVYVAPPDCHLVVEDRTLRLIQTPRENGHRPAIDPTMRSAAAAFDGATVGIVLSGSRDDGTAGMIAIKERGGLTIVQDPDEALYPAMPRSAMDHVTVDAVLRIGEMAEWILKRSGHTPPHIIPSAKEAMSADDPTDPGPGAQQEAPGEGTRYTCPDCGGVLFERHEKALERFECSVGHVFSIESLSSAQAEALEGALWAAVRSLEDRASLLRRLAGRARAGNHVNSARAFDGQATEALERAATIREAISGIDEPGAAASA